MQVKLLYKCRFFNLKHDGTFEDLNAGTVCEAEKEGGRYFCHHPTRPEMAAKIQAAFITESILLSDFPESKVGPKRNTKI